MKMRLSLKADRLKEITDMVSAIVEETRAVVDEDEFRIEAVDSSHVAMVVLSVQPNVLRNTRLRGKRNSV